MKTPPAPRPRKPTGWDRLEERIAELSEKCKLDHWTHYVTDLPVLSELTPAMLTGRPELITAVTPRAMSADETAAILLMVKGLIETNMALRKHAEETAKMVANWSEQFTGLRNIGMQIEHFAHFRKAPAFTPDEDDDDWREEAKWQARMAGDMEA